MDFSWWFLMMLSNVEIPVMLSFEIDHSQPARKWRSVRELAANKCILMIYNWVLGFNNILQMVNHSQIEQEYAENFSKYLLEPKMLCFNFHIFFIYDLISSYIIYRVDMASTMLYLHNLFSHASRGCLPLPVNLFAAYILPVAGCAKEGPLGVCFGCTKSQRRGV